MISCTKNSIILGFSGVDSRDGIAWSTDSCEGQNKSKIVIDASLPKKDKLACGFNGRGCAGRGGSFGLVLGALAS